MGKGGHYYYDYLNPKVTAFFAKVVLETIDFILDMMDFVLDMVDFMPQS